MDKRDDEDLREARSRKSGVFAALLGLAVVAGGGSYWLAARNNAPKPAVSTETVQQPAASEQAVATKPAENAPKQAVQAPVKPTSTETPAEQEVVANQQTAAEQQSAVASNQSTDTLTSQATAKTEITPAPEADLSEPATKPSAQSEVPQTKAETSSEQKVAIAVPPVEPKPTTPDAQSQVQDFPAIPTFDTVRVEPNGDAVIAGRASPLAEVTVKFGETIVGTVTANDAGEFVFVTEKPLPPGAATLTLETALNGKRVVSEQVVAVAVKEPDKGEALVAVVKPDAPPQILQAPTTAETTAPSNTVKLDAVDYDADGNIIFSGRGKPGALIRIYIDNTSAGETNADTDGRWTFGGATAVAPGTHLLRADEIAADGKVMSRVELPFLREEIAKVAAVEPATSPVEPVTEIETNVAASGVEVAEKNEPARMVIQPGNNLWRLSRQVYGQGARYTVIYEANKDQIRNPDLIYPGQVFVMPGSALQP
jgi:hypothetical protein